jgi:hypothetical protein
MVTVHVPHTTHRAGQLQSQRPAPGRPQGRSDRTRAVGRPVDAVLADLAAIRDRYETLRRVDGSFEERARLVTVLHDLRAEAAIARRDLGGADA